AAIRPVAAPSALHAQVAVKRAPPSEHRAIVLCRDLLLARDPGQQLIVRQLDEALAFVELGLGEPGDFRIGEPAHDQIHLAHAAMPRAEQQFAAAEVEPVARSRGSGHEEETSTPKARTGPGEAYIDAPGRLVSGSLLPQAEPLGWHRCLGERSPPAGDKAKCHDPAASLPQCGPGNFYRSRIGGTPPPPPPA